MSIDMYKLKSQCEKNLLNLSSKVCILCSIFISC